MDRVYDKFIGKRILSPHPHPALPLKGREKSERLRPKERENSGLLPLKGRENSELHRPKERESSGFLPFQGEAGGSGFLPLKGGGRRGMGLWDGVEISI